MLPGQLADDLEDLSRQLRVQRRCGLVKKENVRVHVQRPGDGDTLLLSAGELLGIIVLLALQSHLAKELFGFLFDLRPVPLLHMDRRVAQIFHDAVVREEIELLEDQAKIALDLSQFRLSGID